MRLDQSNNETLYLQFLFKWFLRQQALTQFYTVPPLCVDTWWRHQMETLSALLALCAGNSPITGEFPSQRPVTRNLDVFFDLRLNKRLSKQSWVWWFETPWRSLWRHWNVGKVIDAFGHGIPRKLTVVTVPTLSLLATHEVVSMTASCAIGLQNNHHDNFRFPIYIFSAPDPWLNQYRSIVYIFCIVFRKCKQLHAFYYECSTFRWHWSLKSFLVRYRDWCALYSLYMAADALAPCIAARQGISSYCIDLVVPVYSGLDTKGLRAITFTGAFWNLISLKP